MWFLNFLEEERRGGDFSLSPGAATALLGNVVVVVVVVVVCNA